MAKPVAGNSLLGNTDLFQERLSVVQQMAGSKGVVKMLQQFLKTGANSGTLDAALGACKVRSHSCSGKAFKV